MESSSHKGPGLYEFLVEAELQQYYTKIKSDLKIQNTSQLKYVTDDDLYQLEMSKPEVRRLKKYFNKYYPQNYLSKFKKMLLPKKDDQGPGCLMPSVCDPNDSSHNDRLSQSGTGPRVPNKHIISAENIVVNKELGMGEFGVVQQGVWTNDGDRIQVAIKCLSRERMQSNPIEFLKEAAIMHSIDHEHVVRLYGVVLHTDSLMLVTELAPLRSLLECLKEPSLRSSFPVLTLCDFALQICDGMQYLEAKRLIHRDLAARNILVFSKNKVKISDFGLSRALGQGKDYYQTNFNVHLKLPIAWCAPECISYLRFTSASDVWAYGVTLWEMFSYGFQPWAALTGHQILEAIDEPNFQRLDQPECCPKDYFTIMLRCWAHEPSKRPTFAELMTMLPECRPEQLQAIMNTPQEFSNTVPDSNSSNQAFLKREYLQYKVGDVITVLDKGAGPNLWKGILPNGKTGLFNPAHTVAYIGTNLPTSKPEVFSRSDNKYGSTRRKLRTEMISSPQGDLKHTGHVGLDGAYFGDLSFLGGSGGSSDEKHNTLSQYNHLPRQIVAPYRPHEDLDQTPLLGSSASSNTFMTPNTPPPSSHATSIPPNHSNLHASDHIVVSSRQLQHLSGPPGSETNLLKNLPTRSSGSYRNKKQEQPQTVADAQADHEYHEISDEENLVTESPRFEKSFDFGPSLLDEMESMFRNLNSPVLSTPNSPLDHDGVNKCNELRELTSRLGNTNISGGSHTSRSKKQATVKPISAHDQKILDSAIELATEMTARSMNDLDGDPLPVTPASPNKRKFSFRFPSGSGNSEADGSKTERRNFSEEAQAIPDLQQRLRSSLTSLVDTPVSFRLPLWDRASAELCFEKSRELLTKPFLSDNKNPFENAANNENESGTLKRTDSKKSQSSSGGGNNNQTNGTLTKDSKNSLDQTQQRSDSTKRRGSGSKSHNFEPSAPHNSFRDINSALTINSNNTETKMSNVTSQPNTDQQQKTLEQKLLDLIADDNIHEQTFDTNPFRNGSYRDRTLTKSDSFSRKSYNYNNINNCDKMFTRYESKNIESPSGNWYHHQTTSSSGRCYDLFEQWDNVPQNYFEQDPDKVFDETEFTHPFPVEPSDLYQREMANSLALYHRVNRDLQEYQEMNPFSTDVMSRPRALSLSESNQNTIRRSGKTIRERNLRRQSYNPQAYIDSSSSDSEYTSAGSVTHSDMELRSRGRRRRSTLSRLSTSNSSIRSDLLPQTSSSTSTTRQISDLYSIDSTFLHPKTKSTASAYHHRNVNSTRRSNKNVHKNVDLALKNVQKNLATADNMQYLRPDTTSFKSISKSPPPSSSVLSGLSPTTAARWQRVSDTSSESSL